MSKGVYIFFYHGCPCRNLQGNASNKKRKKTRIGAPDVRDGAKMGG